VNHSVNPTRPIRPLREGAPETVRSRRSVLGWLAIAPLASVARAQPAASVWVPEKPVKLIVPFPPGGATDLVSRLLSERVRPHLGQPLVVENRGGANGIIAARAAGTAAPDGYTLFLGAIGTQAINRIIYPQAFNPDEFVPIAAVNTVPTVFAVAKDGRAQSLDDVIKLGRSGQGNYGHWAIASVPHLAGELFKKQAGIPRLEGIPFQGAAQCMQALIGGQIDIANFPLSLARTFSERVRILGLASKERLPSAPEIPTMAELGYPVDVEAWYGVFAPPGTPRPIVDALTTAINATIGDPEFSKRLRDASMKPQSFPSAEAYSAWIKGESTRWAAVLKELGVGPQP
jgi:tripartite-type tricarboxylate transporter receptor subunit TctC